MTEPIDWRREMKEGMDKLADGGVMGLTLIPCWCIASMQAAALAGDAQAASCCEAIIDWNRLAGPAAAEGKWPGCAGCGERLAHHEVAGWAILRPTNIDGSPREGMGGVLVYCDDCSRLDNAALVARIEKTITEVTGNVVMRPN